MPQHDKESLLAHLQEQGFAAQTLTHPAVFTVSEAQQYTAHLPGAHVKNLFLEDKKGGIWLITCGDEQSVKVNGLARLLRCPRLSFAKPERLREMLGVEPGSVTPLALINDHERRVNFVFDEHLLGIEFINVHPLVNTATTTMRVVDLVRFVEGLGYKIEFVDLDNSHVA